MALTQEEVTHLKEVESKWLETANELGRVRTALSKQSRDPELLKQEGDLEAKTDALVSERNALWEKRGYRPGYGPHNKWDQEPGYGPSW
ncbi:MAG TPA: hypothetical protein VHV10_07405 [Ktedonobacteraceae bacterium]|jgi:hypothetical protein|nr:hypothetical protein [Ktedonobacteraceae bacterium]